MALPSGWENRDERSLRVGGSRSRVPPSLPGFRRCEECNDEATQRVIQDGAGVFRCVRNDGVQTRLTNPTSAFSLL